MAARSTGSTGGADHESGPAEVNPGLRRLRATLFIVTTAAVILGTGPAGATFPGRNGLLVFDTRGEDPPARVLTLDPAHDSRHALGAAPELTNAFATWSPDGRRVALVHRKNMTSPSDDTGDTSEPILYVGSGDGRAVRRLAVGTDPAWSPDGRHIAFFSPVQARPVFVADLRSGRIRRVATGGGPPAWSPDGTLLLYGASRVFHGSGLWVVPAAGGKPSRLLRAPSVQESPAWSPDGRRIAFIDDREETLSVLDVRSKRTTVVRRGAATPVWSPNGDTLAYAAPLVGRRTLRVVGADGHRDRSLDAPVAPDPGRPSLAWSPDGTEIAVLDPEVSVVHVATRRARRLFGGSSVFGGIAWPRQGRILIAAQLVNVQHVTVSEPDGSGQRLLTSGPWPDLGPTWSADGRRIAFASDRDGDFELYVMNADGSGTRQVTRNHAQDSGPSWSPDGTRLAFRTDREGRYWQGRDAGWTIGVDGRGARRFASTRLRVNELAWSPDGRYIAYTSENARYLKFVTIAPAGGLGGGCSFSRLAGLIWSPDASLLMVFAPRDGTPVLVESDCGNGRAELPRFSWAPDGSRVSPPVRGDWQPLCTLEGTEGADALVGTDSDDVICGFGGIDTIDGRGGHDVLYGGTSDDTLIGGSGPDWLFGGEGNDTLLAIDAEVDVVDGGPGSDRAATDPADVVSSADGIRRRPRASRVKASEER